MQREIDGPVRGEKRKRDAPFGRAEARWLDARDIDPLSVRGTLSHSRSCRRDADIRDEMESKSTYEISDYHSGGYETDPRSNLASPRSEGSQRYNIRNDSRRYDDDGDMRRIFGEQRRHSRQRPAERETAISARSTDSHVTEDIRARDTREPTDAAKKQPRLQFSKEDTPQKNQPETISEKAVTARLKADKAEAKLEHAQDHLPKKHSINIEKTFDDQKKKTKRRLVFEEEVKSKRAHLKGPPVTRPIKAGTRAVIYQAHRKIHEVEHENVGVEAGHKTERMVEGGLRMASRRRKLAPYRKVEKLERKAAKLNVKAAYQKALSDNPELKNSLLSRVAQKRKIKRDYAKAARQAKKAAKRAKKTGSIVTDITKAVGGFIKRHPVAFTIILLIVLLILLIVMVVSSFTNIAVDGAGAVLSTSYLAPDSDIDAAELAYTEWETELQIEISRAEQTHPGYDEYRYSVDDIGHGPHELMAYLTAAHNDFSYAGIQADLRGIFEEQYHLAYTEEIEIRTRTVTRYDPNTGESYEEEEEYEWRILNVTLTAASFTDVIYPRLDAEQAERYNLLTRIKGNRQYAGSPFSFNWHPYVSDGYGWRIHPVSGGKDYHRGVDIAIATGTEILAAHDGMVSFAGNNGDYGLVVFIDGEKGVQTRYAHCSQILVTQGQSVKMGDVIAKVGSTGSSTGAHLHYEVLKNGQYLNPLYFSITNDDGSCDIPPGDPGGKPIPEYPGAPLDSARFAAMMEEAQKHLGKPYVFGAKGPGKFDCSGFVSWVLRHAGIMNINTNAQGLYNVCTPVSRANAQPGDLIFFTGTYNAGRPVTHVGIYIGNGQMIHAGKPVQYSSIDTPYWTKHQYAFGRLP